MTRAQKLALEWLREHGGDCAVAKTTLGGRIFLAEGETAPFTSATFKSLIDEGFAEYYNHGMRLRLING